jgi:hypothetical protein
MDASQIIYHRNIINFVKKLMQEGKDSPRRGWVMSEILEKAIEKFGPDGYIFGRDYIVLVYCGINEDII